MRYWKRIVTVAMAIAMLLSLALPAAAESYETITLNQEKRVTVSSDNYVIFSFTPTEAGYYAFQSDDYDGDPRATVYDSDMNYLESDDDGGDSWNFDARWYADAGQTYYLEARGYGSYTVQVIQLVAPTSMELDCGITSGYVDPDIWYGAYCTFYPENSVYESVTYSSSNEAVVYTDGYSNYRLLSAGTAVLTATSASGLTASCTITVKEPQTIVCDEVVSINEDDTMCVLLFTPETSGWYGFYSTGEYLDTWGYIEDEDGDQLDYNDYYGQNSNFLARAWMEAGSTYTLTARCSDYDYGYTAQLQVTALSAPQQMTLDDALITMYVTQERWLDYGFSPLLCIPETITWTSSDEKVATVDEEGCVTIVGGGTAVITATSESGLTDSCTVTGKVAPQVTCDDVIIEEYDNGENLYKFVPETSGWYGFYSDNLVGGDPSAIIRNQWFSGQYSNSDNGFDENFLVKAYMEAGQTYYLEPGWSSSGTGDRYEARIAPLSPATGMILSQQTVTKQVSSEVTLTAYTTPLLSISESLTWTSSNEAVATVNNYGEVSCLTVGTAVITATSENGLQASCTVTVVETPTIALNQVVTLENATGAFRHRFTAPQESWYAFGSLNNSRDTYGTLYDADGNYLQSNDDDGEGTNFLMFRYMQAGESCILESRPLSSNATEGTYEIQVTIPPEATGLELSSTSLNGFVDNKGWLDVTLVPENAVPQSVTWSSSNEAVVRVNEYGSLYYLGVGTAVITVTSEEGLTASCTVTVKSVRDIHNGDSVSLKAEDGEQRFRFVPEVTGVYRFYSTGTQVDPWCDVYNPNHNTSHPSDYSDDNFCIYPYLLAGETYELRVNVDEDETGNYTVNLEKAVDATSIQLSQTTITGEPGDQFYLSISTVPENAAPLLEFWSSSDESVAYVDYEGRVTLKGEGTATIVVTTNSGLSASCQVTSAYKTPTPIQCDRPATVSAADGTSWFSFVPQTSGWYRFFSTGDADPYGGFYDADRNSLATSDDWDGNNFSAQCELTAGQTYYLRVRFYGDDAADSCTVEVKKMIQATGVTLSSTQITGYEGDYWYLDAYLLPDDAIPEEYTWTSSNENVVTVSEYGELFLKKVGTAQITVTTTSGLKATCSVTVNAIPVLPLNQAQTLDASQGRYKFKFIPQTSGWYGFYTTGDLDTYGFLRDENGDWYGENDDGAEGYNYMLRCNLEAGKTYYLTSSYYEDYTEGTCTLRVVPLTKPTGIQLTDDQLTVYPDYYFYSSYSFLPLTGYYEDVTWSSSNTAVFTVDEYGDAYSVAPGTAQLTVTSASGLTDSLTVVVAEPPADADNYGRCGRNLLWQRRGNMLTITGFGDMYSECWFGGRDFTQVQLPEGLTSIGAYCFCDVTLQGLVIPASVTKIGYGAFMDSTIPSIRFQGSAPEIQEDAFEDVTTTAYYPQGDASWTAAVRQNYGGNITWVAYDPATMVGVAVSGNVTTGATGSATVELLLNGAVAYTTTVSGKTGSYSFSNVLPGDYTLRVSKTNHVTREYAITVGAFDVTQAVQIKLIGDLNGDGRVNVGDVARIYAHAKRTTFITDPYDLLCANVNGDSRINVGDAARVYAHAKKTTMLF